MGPTGSPLFTLWVGGRLTIADAAEILAHVALGFNAPAWRVRRVMPLPERHRRDDIFIAQEAAADDAIIAMIELAGGDRAARTDAVPHDLREEPHRA